MKNIGALLLCSFMLAACSLSDLSSLNPFASATPTISPAPTGTTTQTFTPIPTQPTPTFTLTPTLIGFKTPTFTPEPGTEPATRTPIITSTSSIIIPTQVLEGFAWVKLSTNEFYLGRCEPASVEFTAQVAQPDKAPFVVLFVRLKSVVTGSTSRWTDLGMTNLGAGTFTHTLVPDEIKSLSSFEQPWVQYQLVAAAAGGKEVGRTQIFDELLRLKNCPLTATPTP